MGTTAVYDRGKFCVATGIIQLNTSDLRVLLVNSSYVFNVAHRFTDLVASGAELSGSGYARQKLQSVVVTQDDANARVTFSANPAVWPGASFGTPDAAIIYKENTTDALREALCSLNLNPKVLTAGGSFTVQFNSVGILLIQ